MKILYVDDEQINRLFFNMNFAKLFPIVLASNGAEGLKKLKENPDISVIVSDMKMPGMNGIEFITEAKKEKEDLPCYILTGFDITVDIHEAIETKTVERYFQKPIDVDAMKEELTKCN
ncbi:response regulator [Bacteroidales bacterium]|nr:response regulator [Bacteroidales bacterium]